MTALVLAAPGRTPDVLAAERSVLGSALVSKSDAEAITEYLPSAECFTDGTHQAVYEAIRHVVESGGVPDLPSVLHRLVAVETGVWHTGQAGVVLAGLAEAATPAWHGQARAVLQAHQRRRGVLALGQAQQIYGDPAADPAEAAGLVRDLLDEALDPVTPETDALAVSDLFWTAVDRISRGEPAGVIEYPFADLQALLGHMRPGELISVGARPSMGKSQLAMDIARHASIGQKQPGILFTLEMDRRAVMDRLIAAEAGVPLMLVRHGGLTEVDWDRISRSGERFAEAQLVIDDTPRIGAVYVRSRVRRLLRTTDLQYVVVDYLQLMDAGTGPNREREVAALVGGLKGVAREFGIPIVMLFQLNRGPESRTDKKPLLSDARESGAVENDSDVVILIHREDYYERESPRAGEADLIVAKNRNGPTATVTVGFQGHYSRFVDLVQI